MKRFNLYYFWIAFWTMFVFLDARNLKTDPEHAKMYIFGIVLDVLMIAYNVYMSKRKERINWRRVLKASKEILFSEAVIAFILSVLLLTLVWTTVAAFREIKKLNTHTFHPRRAA